MKLKHQRGSIGGFIILLLILIGIPWLIYEVREDDAARKKVREGYSQQARDWFVYSKAECAPLNRLYGATLQLGKYNYRFDGTQVSCPDGLLYTVSRQIELCAVDQNNCYGLNSETIPHAPKK